MTIKNNLVEYKKSPIKKSPKKINSKSKNSSTISLGTSVGSNSKYNKKTVSFYYDNLKHDSAEKIPKPKIKEITSKPIYKKSKEVSQFSLKQNDQIKPYFIKKEALNKKNNHFKKEIKKGVKNINTNLLIKKNNSIKNNYKKVCFKVNPNLYKTVNKYYYPELNTSKNSKYFQKLSLEDRYLCNILSNNIIISKNIENY